jgi:hypothetical protein
LCSPSSRAECDFLAHVTAVQGWVLEYNQLTSAWHIGGAGGRGSRGGAAACRQNRVQRSSDRALGTLARWLQDVLALGEFLRAAREAHEVSSSQCQMTEASKAKATALREALHHPTRHHCRCCAALHHVPSAISWRT